jgi:hypothetical protein
MKKLNAIKSDDSGNFIFFYHKKGVDVIDKSELIDVELQRVKESLLIAPFNRNAEVSIILTILTALIALLCKDIRRTDIYHGNITFIEIIPLIIVAIVFAYFISLIQYSAKQKSTVIYIKTTNNVYDFKIRKNKAYSDIYLHLKPYFQKYLPKEGDLVANKLNRKETLENYYTSLFFLFAPRINVFLIFSAFSGFIPVEFTGIWLAILVVLFFIHFLGNIEKVIISISELFHRIIGSRRERMELIFSNSVLRLRYCEDHEKYTFENFCFYKFSLKGNNLEISTTRKQRYIWQSDSLKLEGEYRFINKYEYMGFALVDYFNECSRNDEESVTKRIVNQEVSLSNDFLQYITDREIIMKEVKSNGHSLEYVSKEFKSDRDIVLAAIMTFPKALEFASVDLKKDPEIVLTALRLDRGSLEFVSYDLLKDHETVIESLKHVGSKILDYFEIPSELWNNRKFNLELVKQDGKTLGLLLHKFKTDREIVLEAVKESSTALKYASKEFRGNREIVLEAVKSEQSSWTNALRYASKELKGDRALVLEAIKTDARAFKYALQELRRDRTFIMKAVRLNGRVLGFSLAKYRNDREIVFEAVKSNGIALENVSKEFIKDKEIVFEAVKSNGLVLQFATQFSNDREIVIEAVRSNGAALQFASEILREDGELIREALKSDFQALQYVSLESINYREIVLELVISNGESLKYASKELRSDRKLVLEAIKSEGRSFIHISTALKNDREFVLEAVKSNGLVLQFATQFSFDREIVIEAVRSNGAALQFASELLREDGEVIREALKSN